MIAVLLSLFACDAGELIGTREAFPDSGMFCDADTDVVLSDGFASALTPEGCHYMIAAADSEAETLLLLDVPVFAEALAGSAASADYTLPDDAVRFEVQTGCALQAGVCVDVDTEPTISRTYTATAGSVSVSARPDGDELLADISLTDVALVDLSGASVSISAVSWTDVRLYGGYAE